MVEAERPQMTIQRRVACWVSKAIRAQTHPRSRAPSITHAHTHAFTQREIYNTSSFLRQQQFSESDWMLNYAYISSFVYPSLKHITCWGSIPSYVSQRKLIVVYRHSVTANQSHLQASSTMFNDGTDRLSQNVGKHLRT
jgi:hypothetical protein